MSAVDTARDALLSVIEPFREELHEASSRVTTLQSELQPLEEALQKLDAGKKAKTKAARKASKPCVRKQDVMDICMALVEANQPIGKDDLTSLAKHKVTETGQFSLSGVSLRLAECLASDAFTVAADGAVTLSSSSMRLGAA